MYKSNKPARIFSALFDYGLITKTDGQNFEQVFAPPKILNICSIMKLRVKIEQVFDLFMCDFQNLYI
jgi:hypothetical protein